MGISLSSFESEYFTLSQALREALPFMDILKEINNNGLSYKYIPGKVSYKAFEEN